MSMTLMAKAMGIRVGHPIRKLVLLKLADNANDKGECWPSTRHIADHCECSKSTVRSHVDALVEMGLVQKTNRIGRNNGKGNASNVYLLTLDNPISALGTGGDKATPMPASDIAPMPGGGIAMPDADSPMPGDGITPMPPHGTRTYHSFEPVIEPVTEPKECQADELPDDIDEPALKVLNHLNKTTGARFQDGQTTMGFINGLLVGEYVADELILVIDHRNEMWGADQKMSQYLRPSTIFDFKAFEEYLPLARKWDEEGRLSLREPEIDTAERDAAYRRLWARGTFKTPLEIRVRKAAGQANIGQKSPEAAKREWDRLWMENAKAMQSEARKS
ncbi:conserved phage C-terminal domain-containing protein [Cedecea neteri]|uniref:conserved phage C-terminal domain-containing protein n=1 Tax=Cedecea neteri TaxID=158822 RepID=UPI00068E5338|nr:conserved phage C-terminal domain-containing protein [Cedecea neteri]